MKIFGNHWNILKKLSLIGLTALLVVGGSLLQTDLLKVQASVQVLLVSRTAIAFGDVFPGQAPAETYTVQLDTSASSAVYVTTLDPLPGLQNLCPFLSLTSADVPAEPDVLASSVLTRPGDILDKWQVKLNVPGIKGELSQDHTGGIIIEGGDFGCKITITTESQPGKIIICKTSIGGTGTFNYTGDLGSFSIHTASSSKDNISGAGYGNQTDPCGGQDPCNGGSGQQTADRGGSNQNIINCITSTTVTNSNSSTVTNIVSSGSNSGGNGVSTGNGDINNVSVDSGYSSGSASVETSVNSINSDVNTGQANSSGSKIFNNLQPGTYTVAESSSTDWTLTSLICRDPDNNTTISNNSAAINVAAGQTVTCAFTNTLKKKGKIIIQKHALGGDGSFNFSGNLGAFSLQTAAGTAGKTFDNLDAGSYTVVENVVLGWKLYSLACTDPSHDTLIYGSSANIKLANGETVTCVFTNKKKGAIIIHKKTGGDDDSCDFSGSLGSFSLPTHQGTGSQAFSNLDSGSYNISENAKGGWAPHSVVCTGGAAVVNGNSAKINLSDGQTVDCTFTDAKKK